MVRELRLAVAWSFTVVVAVSVTRQPMFAFATPPACDGCIELLDESTAPLDAFRMRAVYKVAPAAEL
jgi:hypothetical protein